jgi:hypothetical protein
MVLFECHLAPHQQAIRIVGARPTPPRIQHLIHDNIRLGRDAAAVSRKK